MSESASPHSASQPDPVNWSELEHNPEYQELRRSQRRFLIPTSVIYLVVYFGFLIVTLSAPTLFRRTLHAGLNIGFLLMTAMFVLVWVAVLVHNSVARRRWDPRIARLQAEAEAPQHDPAGAATTSDGQVTR